MKRFYVGYLFLIITLLLSCSADDPSNEDMEEGTVTQTLPQIAILGTDLTDGTGPHLRTWDTTYTESQTDLLPELLAYDFARIKNIVNNRIGVEIISPTSNFILYDIQNETIEEHPDFFIPENGINNFFTLNTEDVIATYYLDNDSTCCNIFLNSFNLESQSNTTFFLGNLDVAPVQLNTFVRANKAFLTGVDTFTGATKIFVHDLETNLSLGSLDISDYDSYYYNDEQDEIYFIDFEAGGLSYDILDLDFFSVTSTDTFTSGVTPQSGFNNARFEGGQMIFKQTATPQSSVPLDAIFNFADNTIISFEGTELFNSIATQTGRSINIIDTEVDLETQVYIIAGTFQENGIMQGITLFMDFEKNIVQSVLSDTIRPDEIILLK